MKPFSTDTFRMTDFVTELHREEREEEHIDHLRPVRHRAQRTWRQMMRADIDEQRATKPDYRHIPVLRVNGLLPA